MACMVSLLFEAAFNSANFLVALMLQQAFHFTPYQAGLILAPGAVVMGMVGVGAGRLADVIDPRGSMLLGSCSRPSPCIAWPNQSRQHCGMAHRLDDCVSHVFWLRAFAPDHDYPEILPPERLSMGSGLDGIHRGFASAFGIALGSMLVERRLLAHETALGEEHEQLTSSVGDAARAVTETLTQAGIGSSEAGAQALAALWNYLRQTAQIAAYQDAFLVLCGVTLLALLPAMFARASRRSVTVPPGTGR